MRVEREELQRAMVQALEAASLFVLPIRRTAYRSHSGSRMGRESGVSPNFREHRLYVPGDDVRHLDWRVSARTGKPVLRLFHQEIVPALELLIDPSASMELTEAKRTRVLELAAYVMQAARHEQVAPRIWIVTQTGATRLSEREFARGWEGRCVGKPPFEQVSLRTGSFRVVLSDLLFVSNPRDVVRSLGRDASGVLFLVPWSMQEAEPDWERMNLLEDCESEQLQTVRTDGSVREEYREAYEQHFAEWSALCQASGAHFIRVADQNSLLEDLGVAWRMLERG